MKRRCIAKTSKNIDYAWHKAEAYLKEKVVKQEITPIPVEFLSGKSKIFFVKSEYLYTILNKKKRLEVLVFLIPMPIVHILGVIKSFKFF